MANKKKTEEETKTLKKAYIRPKLEKIEEDMVEEVRLVEEVPPTESVAVDAVLDEEEIAKEKRLPTTDLERWAPKTELGRKVKSGEIRDIDAVLDSGMKIMEHEIVDILLPGMESDLLLIGQAKGKFGGGKRRVFRQTQKKTMEGNKPKFTCVAVIGDKNGHVGIGYGKSKETVPAREKALRNAKLNIIKIRRGSGAWDAQHKEPNSIPFRVEGKCGSVRLALIPAPKGTGLKIENECGKIMVLAGIKDIRSMSRGSTKTKMNMINACEEALRQLTKMKIKYEDRERLTIVEGSYKPVEESVEDA